MAQSRKILNLPDIDNSGQEVFESPDVEDIIQAVQPEQFASPDIEVVPTNMRKAIASLKGVQLFEGVGQVDEDPLGGHLRISHVNSSLTNLTEELNAMLKQVDSKTNVPQPSVQTTPPSLPSGHVLELERRLTNIEKTLGPDSQDLTGPLQGVVSKLESRLTLLDSGVLDDLTKRVRTVEREMDKIISKKQQYNDVTNADHAKKIDDAYGALQRCDAVSPHVPVLVNRLMTLKHLHDDADGLGNALRDSQNAEFKIESMLSDSRQLLKTMEENFAQNLNVIEANMKKMDGKMQDIASQFEKQER